MKLLTSLALSFSFATSAFAVEVGTIPILNFNGEKNVLEEGFSSEEVRWTHTGGNPLVSGFRSGQFDVILIHQDKVEDLVDSIPGARMSQPIMANAIGLFLPAAAKPDFARALDQSGASPVNQLVNTFSTTQLPLLVNNLKKLRRLSDSLVSTYGLDPRLVVDTNASGLDAVRQALANDQATLMGLHPALRANVAPAANIVTVPSKLFYVPVVALYREEGEDFVSHLLSRNVQSRIGDIRKSGSPELEIWWSGTDYRAGATPRLRSDVVDLSLDLPCTSFTITQSVPLDFSFEFVSANSFDAVEAISEFGTGTLTCEEQGSTVVCSPEGEEPAVEFFLNSEDPDRQGQILRGFSAGEFFIGRGGWDLRCTN